MLVVVCKLDTTDCALDVRCGRSRFFDDLGVLLGFILFFFLLEHILLELLLECLVVVARIFTLLLQLEDAGASRGIPVVARDVESAHVDSRAQVPYE